MTWQLRATAGPLEGAVYVLRRRATLGRAGDCDIQIINDGVSRKHAKVVSDGDGHALVDLSSNNGTYVGDERVTRRPLCEGDEFRIMRARFVYERSADDDGDVGESNVWAVKVTNGSTLRQTVDHLAVAPPSPLRGDTEDDIEARTPTSRRRARNDERHPMTALRADGQPYPGDLVSDILMFRDLQLRMTRQDSLTTFERELLQRFGEAFRQPANDPSPFAALRRFQRFRCRFPARVRWLEGALDQADTVTVQDLGVGGARVAWHGHPMRDGVVAWLVVDVASGHSTRTLVFPTRVAWTAETELGLQFAGMPEWERASS